MIRVLWLCLIGIISSAKLSWSVLIISFTFMIVTLTIRMDWAIVLVLWLRLIRCTHCFLTPGLHSRSASKYGSFSGVHKWFMITHVIIYAHLCNHLVRHRVLWDGSLLSGFFSVLLLRLFVLQWQEQQRVVKSLTLSMRSIWKGYRRWSRILPCWSFFLLGGVFWNYSLLAVCIFVRWGPCNFWPFRCIC